MNSHSMKRLLHRGIAAAASMACAASLSGALLVETHRSNPGALIPDGIGTGLRDDLQVGHSAITSIQYLVVRATIDGEYNGDLYVYIQHDTGLTVLINRPGRTADNPYCYGDPGLNITLSDAAPHDIHLYQDHVTLGIGSRLEGVWQPDGRRIDPDLVLDSSPRDFLLDQFIGLDPRGQWTLFAADLERGGINRLESWELEIGGVVPEPAATALVASLVSALAILCRRRRHPGRRS